MVVLMLMLMVTVVFDDVLFFLSLGITSQLEKRHLAIGSSRQLAAADFNWDWECLAPRCRIV